MPPHDIWNEDRAPGDARAWRDTAQLLVATCEDPKTKKQLRRAIRDLPNDLRKTVGGELERRRKLAGELRSVALRQAAMLSFLSPHRQLDALILLWLNLRQVYSLSRCYGFKPSPRGICRLYGSVLGSALTLEAFDEIAEQTIADAVSKIAGGIPIAGQAASMIYDPIRAAAYVGFIGLVSEHLLRSEMKKPNSSERRELRKEAWKNAAAELPKLQSGSDPATEPS